MFSLLAAAPEPRGWGGLAALALAPIAYLLIIHSPTLLRGAVSGVKSLVRGGVTPSDTTSDTDDDTASDTDYEWGRITHDTASGGRDTGPDTTSRWGRLTHIWRTGSSPAPPGPPAVEEREPEKEESTPETIEEFVDRVDGEMPYMEMVREIMRRYDASESKAKKRIRDARAARE